MSSQWVEQYVQERINQARRELDASNQRPDNLATMFKQALGNRPALNKQVGSSKQLASIDRITDRVASRVKPALQQRQPGGYVGQPESSKPGFQGMYSDELFRRSGFYADEWERLHGRTP